MEKILINKIRCNKCGAVSVDGGHMYLRRCGNQEDWTELSELEK